MLVCNVICFCTKETVILIIYKKYTNFVFSASLALGPWILALGPWPLAVDGMLRIVSISILTVKLYLY